jgi:threonine synthase
MTDVEIPYPLKGLKERETLHEGVIAKDHILSFIGERIKEF